MLNDQEKVALDDFAEKAAYLFSSLTAKDIPPEQSAALVGIYISLAARVNMPGPPGPRIV